MCKIIGSDAVIGNALIEAVKHDKFEIKISDICRIDRKVNAALINENIYTSFSLVEIKDFHFDYPFFVSEINDHVIKLNEESKTDSKLFLKRLARYFRIGLPTSYIYSFIETSEAILGVK